MTENEALEELKTFPVNCLDFKENQALQVAIKALEELKELKNGGIPIIHGKAELELHDKEIRNKAIDEFAERIKKEAADGGWNCHSVYSGGCDYISCEKCESSFLKEIDEIAEQMKGGE